MNRHQSQSKHRMTAMANPTLLPDPDPIVYDLETYMNVFTACFYRPADGARWQFECSERVNQISELLTFLSECGRSGVSFVGYNNIGFDYPVLHTLTTRADWAGLTGQGVAEILWQKAQEIIAAGKQNKPWLHVVRKPLIPQIDLYKIHHFDNQAKRTSLKWLEVNMRSLTVQDLPLDPLKPVPVELIDDLLKYNWHDVEETARFMAFSKDMIDFRKELSQRYKNPAFMNFNDTKVGEQVFIDKLEDAGIKCFDWVDNRRAPRQTHRPYIDFSRVVFDWIQFEQPAFQAVKEWFKQLQITETKGVLNDLPAAELGAVAEHAAMREKKGPLYTDGQPVPAHYWVHEQKNGKKYLKYNMAENLNVVIDGFQFDFGVGGIHGSVESTIVRSDADGIIIDLDVASYYPNLAIANKLYPEHLGPEFCDIYKGVFDERRSHKKAKRDATTEADKNHHEAAQAMLKLALNGVYGKSNSNFSCFYDPEYTMKITVNGQLLLCLLAEWLMKIPDLQMVQVNTDGLTVRVPRDHEHHVYTVARHWEQSTGLELEDVTYSMMAIRDVNNYLAVTDDGKVKRKGCYCHETTLENPNTMELSWHKQHSNRVVALAAQAALVDGVSVREFIMNHDDVFDFCAAVKVPRSMRLELRYPDGQRTPLENITRYYVSNTGGSLVKIMPPLKGKADERENSIEAGWLVQPVNDMADYRGDICYEYYIKEAEKIVMPLLT